MTKRRAISTALSLWKPYTRSFDDLFGKRSQRDEFRHYLEDLQLPTERNKTLTGLANTEPFFCKISVKLNTMMSGIKTRDFLYFLMSQRNKSGCLDFEVKICFGKMALM
ncbi:hypothetical protein [Dictyobacter formicarum]|uniref:Uncharacterized protein n=1 Tax=Dictyobacter formicarum TaxID=2778368 RepID=A0ABQ3VI91_9CHLR|nr:hypothetical protein [Dictyobacter formicarum]GHO85196.1 hypothetical protein KSZ_32020 [Dictyobacter formicarum]